MDRSFSNYRFACQKGRESLSFPNAVRREIQQNNLDPFFGYLERSIYVNQIKNYLKYFSIHDIHFLSFESLVDKAQYQEELDKLLEFLQVDKVNLEFQWANKTKVKPSLVNRMIQVFNGNHKGLTEKLDIDTKELLQEFFVKYNEELSELTGINTNSWNNTIQT